MPDDMNITTETHWTRILSYDLVAGDTGAMPASTRAGELRAPHVDEKADFAIDGERVDLTTADGQRVVATRYRAPTTRKAKLVVAGAMAVPQRYYRRFAQFAAESGYETMTLDYRGIGLSA